MKRAARPMLGRWQPIGGFGWGGAVLVGLVMLYVVSACAPPAPTGPTVAPSKPTEAKGETWDQVLAAAKQEGKIVVVGPIGPTVRDVLVGEFQKQYPEIQVEFTGSPLSQVTAKLLQERAGGLFLMDVMVAAPASFWELLPSNALAPLESHLVGPEAADQSKWRGGKFLFSDSDGKFNLIFVSQVQEPIAFNTKLASASEFTSWQDLLSAKWAGKIAMGDPRRSGTVNVASMFAYARLGEDYYRRLLTTKPRISRDDQQVLDWVASGESPVAFGPSPQRATPMIKNGLPLALISGSSLKEGAVLNAGNSSVSVLDRAPHPNAAKVYLNWLLSKDAQLALSKATGEVSRRLEVPTDHLDPNKVPKDGVDYYQGIVQNSSMPVREKMWAFAKSVLGD